MSTTLLYRVFGIRGYRYQNTQYAGGGVTFAIDQERDSLCCSVCGSSDVKLRGSSEPRIFRLPPIGGKPTYLSFSVPRVECVACDVVRQVSLSFAEPRARYTKSFARYALGLSRRMTIQDVADHLGVGWETIKEIQKDYLGRRFKKPKLKHLRQLAIDEISVAKNHRYVTVVLDLKSGAVVFVGDGKGADALAPFWKRLRRSGAQVEAIAIDMSQAYISAVKDNLPQATIVFDHFHVVKLYNEKLSNLRRELHRKATEEEKSVLKGTRWLLLKNPENLRGEKNEIARLEEALELNRDLALAYYMKEDLRQVWEQDSYEEAETYLMDWIVRAEASGLSMLCQFAKTLRFHALGILAYYDYEISTGPLEGTNNKIKTMKRQAYGFRDHDFFKLKILAIHETNYKLVG